MIALDTNILVYAHRSKCHEYKKARKTIENAAKNPQGCGIPLPVITEFWSVVTHPLSTGRPSMPKEAWEFLEYLHNHIGFKIWNPQDGFFTRVAQLAVDLKISGLRIFDLQIALVAFENGARELWTQDRSFIHLPGLRCFHPF